MSQKHVTFCHNVKNMSHVGTLDIELLRIGNRNCNKKNKLNTSKNFIYFSKNNLTSTGKNLN